MTRSALRDHDALAPRLLSLALHLCPRHVRAEVGDEASLAARVRCGSSSRAVAAAGRTSLQR